MSEFRCLPLIVACLLATTAVVSADEPPIRFGPWKVLYRGSSKTSISQLSDDKFPFQPLDQFTITGEMATDPFRLNQVQVDGTWAVTRGVLHQANGRSAAIKLGRAEDFELEMGINAEGEGGWFLLYGYNDGQGHGLYNVTLKTSGSPWFVSQFARGHGLKGTDQEIARYECRGDEPILIRVAGGKLTVSISRRTLIEDLDLPDYEAGDIILGTYDTKYGPKPIKIYGIRLREPRE